MEEIGKHYKFKYRGVKIDPYRIFKVYGISDPAQQHAIKKLLRAGKSVKELTEDIDEVIATLSRWKEMIEEDRVDEVSDSVAGLYDPEHFNLTPGGFITGGIVPATIGPILHQDYHPIRSQFADEGLGDL